MRQPERVRLLNRDRKLAQEMMTVIEALGRFYAASDPEIGPLLEKLRGAYSQLKLFRSEGFVDMSP